MTRVGIPKPTAEGVWLMAQFPHYAANRAAGTKTALFEHKPTIPQEESSTNPSNNHGDAQ
jgi:hypothetical protein